MSALTADRVGGAGPREGDQMTSRAISKQNVLNKICFVIFGSGVDTHAYEFRASLLAYLSDRADKLISRQTIIYWFSKNSLPSRAPAFIFLKEYLEARADYQSISPDQKKVHTQCINFLEVSVRSSDAGKPHSISTSGVQASGSSNILLRSTHDPSDLEKFSDSWQGTYITYRLRLLPSNKAPVAQEVVRISRRNRELVYQHWHRREGVSVDKFEGLIAVRPNSVWMFGANKEDTRFRVCHFRANNTINPVHQVARWGLMHSDIPLSSSYEPASTRILMLLHRPRIANFETFLDQTVRYREFSQLSDGIEPIVRRAIINELPSASQAGSSEPAEVSESILKVDQRTLEEICNQV